ncbi:Uu.00g106480.m01.CDS01 [Anthostomella pinea]|uniref:Uu.00g106480.m01.CDS01 n=1 Tax=Anthostomella pinea TaxID=933095 RepID=A0AAI8YFX0_9PEZI|nr:Uu.00g106480.m01.CDS01 [Anthostomella pinea]
MLVDVHKAQTKYGLNSFATALHESFIPSVTGEFIIKSLDEAHEIIARLEQGTTQHAKPSAGGALTLVNEMAAEGVPIGLVLQGLVKLHGALAPTCCYEAPLYQGDESTEFNRFDITTLLQGYEPRMRCRLCEYSLQPTSSVVANAVAPEDTSTQLDRCLHATRISGSLAT